MIDPPTPSQRMHARSTRQSSIDDGTAQQIADHRLDQLIADAKTGRPLHHHGYREHRALRYRLSATVDIVFVLNAAGEDLSDDVHYAVLSYDEGYPHARSTIDGLDAQILFQAIQHSDPRQLTEHTADTGHATPQRLFIATDPQPHVPDDKLDAGVWTRNGVQGATVPQPQAASTEEIRKAGENLVRDNTARAGMALRAVQASAKVPENATTSQRCTAAITAYLDAEPTSWMPVDVETAVHVRNLLADIMHLADARGVPAGTTDPTYRASILQSEISRLNHALQDACLTSWSATLADPWPTILSAAAHQHDNQIHATT